MKFTAQFQFDNIEFYVKHYLIIVYDWALVKLSFYAYMNF